jgi:hypothetical protein
MSNNKYIDMKKLNGFESWLILEGLKLAADDMKNGIEKMESEGKRALMTTGYVDMIVKDAVEKVKSLTVKQK